MLTASPATISLGSVSPVPCLTLDLFESRFEQSALFRADLVLDRLDIAESYNNREAGEDKTNQPIGDKDNVAHPAFKGCFAKE
jgi:hypothetical protein